MATATAQERNGTAAATQTQSAASELLERVLSLPASQRQREINDCIERRIEKVAAVLPASLKDQAERFVKRAEITFARTAGDPYKDIYTCTPESIVRCVIEAAEIGLAIDGKLCYAVPYNRNVGDKRNAKWQRECQLQIDYKGLIVVARRSGQISDAWAREVRDNDTLEHSVDDGKCHLHHTWDARQPRGDTYCVYGIVQFPGGGFRYEIMDLDELKAIRQRSKAKDSGPWVTDTGQMYCKTVLRRILKLYCDDPAVGMALEIDEREFTEDLHPIAAPQRTKPASLSERIAAKTAPAEPAVADETHNEPADDTDQSYPDAPSVDEYSQEESEVEA